MYFLLQCFRLHLLRIRQRESESVYKWLHYGQKRLRINFYHVAPVSLPFSIVNIVVILKMVAKSNGLAGAAVYLMLVHVFCDVCSFHLIIIFTVVAIILFQIILTLALTPLYTEMMLFSDMEQCLATENSSEYIDAYKLCVKPTFEASAWFWHQTILSCIAYDRFITD